MASRLSRRITLGALTLWGVEAGMFARQNGDLQEDEMGRVIAGVLTVGLACSPTTTSIEQAWISDSTRRFDLSNVVTMSTSPDGVVRRSLEDRLARELLRMGVRSVPAYAVLDDGDRMDRRRVVDELSAGGYSAVIVMRFVGESARTPGTFGAYLETAGVLYGPGALGTLESAVRLETSVYTLHDDQLVWSALSKTIDPENLRDLIANYTHVVASELSRRDVVASH